MTATGNAKQQAAKKPIFWLDFLPGLGGLAITPGPQKRWTLALKM